jgi:hypothetical protein
MSDPRDRDDEQSLVSIFVIWLSETRQLVAIAEALAAQDDAPLTEGPHLVAKAFAAAAEAGAAVMGMRQPKRGVTA